MANKDWLEDIFSPGRHGGERLALIRVSRRPLIHLDRADQDLARFMADSQVREY